MHSDDREQYLYLPLMTVSEAAQYLGVGRKIIYQLIEYNQLKAIRHRGAVRIEKRSVEDLSRRAIIF